MKRAVVLALCLASSLAGACVQRSSPAEAVAALDLPDDLVRRDGRGGVTIARSWAEAEFGMAALKHAEAIFTARFGETPRPGAVVDRRHAALEIELRRAGARWVTPWAFDDPAAAPRGDILAHEIGHAMFVATLMPASRPFQYGGDAPDWLDEAVALVMEPPGSLDRRRARFRALAQAGRVPALSHIAVMEHPIFASARLRAAIGALHERPPAHPVAMALSIDDLGVKPEDVGDFYALSLGVADFLIALSGDEAALGLVARDIRDTGAADGWMARFEGGGALLDARFAAWSAQVSRAAEPSSPASLSPAGSQASRRHYAPE